MASTLSSRRSWPDDERLTISKILVLLGIIGLFVAAFMLFWTIPNPESSQDTCGTLWTPIGAGMSCVQRRHAQAAVTLLTLAISCTALVTATILAWRFDAGEEPRLEDT